MASTRAAAKLRSILLLRVQINFCQKLKLNKMEAVIWNIKFTYTVKSAAMK